MKRNKKKLTRQKFYQIHTEEGLAAYQQDKYFGLLARRHTNTTRGNLFVRMPSRAPLFAKGFYKAGYPSYLLTNMNRWEEIHKWCSENLTDYIWCGSVFFFLDEKDLKKFLRNFEEKSNGND